MEIVKVGMIGVLGMFLALSFKSGKTEYSVCISIGISLFILFQIVGKLDEIIKVLYQLSEFIHCDQAYLRAFLKMLGVTYVAEFSSSICKESGYQTIAMQIELFGKITIMVMSMPILLAFLQTVQGVLK